MKFKTYAQYFNVRIQYIFFEINNKVEAAENVVHSIRTEKIFEKLEQKDYVLGKADIVELLKEDGAHFFEDSLRIYDPEEENYFQISDDWELVVDQDEPEFSLLFWIKSTNQNFKKRVDDLAADVKNLKESFRAHTESVKNEIKSNFDKLVGEIERLKKMNQILITQITKLYEKQSLSPGEDEGEDADQKMTNIISLNKENPSLDALSDYPLNLVSSKSHPEQIDIALMYSEPLIKRDEYGILALGEPVDFEEECNKLIEIFRSKDRRCNVYFEIATLEHLVNVLSLNPTILHIICHGEYNKQRGQFYLCFEDNGELREVYSENLKGILNQVDLKTKIVFVNACHSEEVAKVFNEAGIPCVIAVQSELKIDDYIAQKFSENFYWQLFEGKSVGEAFRFAKAGAAGNDVYTCCCAHSHDEDCNWYKLAKEEGFEKAHHLHTRTCTCPFKNKFLHKEDCMWAFDFLIDACKKDEIPEGLIHACCCRPTLEHNEALKFKLICSDESILRQPLFQGRPKGSVSIKSYHSCVEQKFPVKRLTGRNKELHELYEILTDKNKKFVNLYGIEGVGKSVLVKQLANYLWERGFFKDKISIIMLEKTPSITHFRSDLFKEVEGSYDLKSFCESIKTSRMLFILEKCDRLIEEHYEQFRHDLAYITENAINVKFVLITNKEITLGMGESWVWMREFKKLDAARFLIKIAYPFLSYRERNAYELAQHGIFDLKPLTPTYIWSITEKLRSNKTLDEIEREITLEKEKFSEETTYNENDEITRESLE